MACRILFIGDMHIGRRPGGLPADMDERPFRAADLTPAAALKRAVAEAIDKEVHAVVFAGDLVDSMDDRFEAFGPVEEAVTQLLEARIPVYAVAGNHDSVALSRLADRIGAFHLLGAGGRWESTVIEGDGTTVHLHGWSFPAKSAGGNPLDHFERPRRGTGASLGVLHCDLDGSDRRYAPVPRSALADGTDLDGWFLGHVHKPSFDALAADRPIGYLGSLSGLDAGEPGPHGPWLVETEGAGAVKATQIPLAPIRYEQEELSVENISGDDEELLDSLVDLLHGALGAIQRRVGGVACPPVAVACRFTLTGRTAHRRAIRAFLAENRRRIDRRGEVYCFVEKIIDRSESILDIDEIARGFDLPARLAKQITALDSGGAECEELLREGARALDAAVGHRRWAGVIAPPDAGETGRIRAILRAAAIDALEELLAQRADDSEAPPS